MVSDVESHLFTTPLRLAESRAKVYALLATVYIKPPDRDFLKSFMTTLSSLDIQKMGEMLPKGITEGIRNVESYLRSRSESVEQEQLLFSTEFTRLFRGIKRHGSPPPPFESVYREGVCWGESTVEVLEEYRRFGLAPNDEYQGEPPDHISLELDFMRFLCEKEAGAWLRGDSEEALRFLNAEEGFLNDRLSKWVGEFCQNIREQDRLGFYAGWADVTEAWIGFDHLQIGECMAAADNK